MEWSTICRRVLERVLWRGFKDFGFQTYSGTTCCWDRQVSDAPLADSAWAVWTVVVRRPGVAGLVGLIGTGRPPVVVGRKRRKNWPWPPGLSIPVPRCSSTIWKFLQREIKRKMYLYIRKMYSTRLWYVVIYFVLFWRKLSSKIYCTYTSYYNLLIGDKTPLLTRGQRWKHL